MEVASRRSRPSPSRSRSGGHRSKSGGHRSSSPKKGRRGGGKSKSRSKGRSPKHTGAEPSGDRSPSPPPLTPSTPPPRAAYPPVEQPAARLDAFEGDVSASRSGFTANSRSNGQAESFLHEAGLGGSSVYDLRALERAVDEELASADDEDLGPDDEELEMLRSGTWSGSGLAALTPSAGPGARDGSLSRSGSFVSRSGGSFGGGSSFKRGGSFRTLSRATSFKRGGSFRAPSPDGGEGGDGDGDDDNDRSFEARAQRLSRGRSGTRLSAASATDVAVEAVDDRRPQHPRPTPVSDVSSVLGWLEKHIAPEVVAAAAAKQSAASQPAGLEGMLSKWKARAQGRVAEAHSASDSAGRMVDDVEAKAVEAFTAAGGGASGGGGGRSSAPSSPLLAKLKGAASRARSEGKASGDGGWLKDLATTLKEDAAAAGAASPDGGRQSVWERQAALEVSVEQQIEQREEERRTRRTEARRARHELRRSRGPSGWSDSDSEEEDDDEWQHASSSGARPSSWDGEDESVSKFQGQVPLLEERKAECKAKCFAAERALRTQLGRKPTEAERRHDETWGRAAIAFKEADEALFVAKSLCSWDD